MQANRPFLVAGRTDGLTIATVAVRIGGRQRRFGVPGDALGVTLVASRADPFGLVPSTWLVQRPA